MWQTLLKHSLHLTFPTRINTPPDTHWEKGFYLHACSHLKFCLKCVFLRFIPLYGFAFKMVYTLCVCVGACVCVFVCFVFRRMSHSLPDTRCSRRRLHPCQYTQIVDTLAYAQSIRECINVCNVCVRLLCEAEFPLLISSHLHMAHGRHHRGCGGWGCGEW